MEPPETWGREALLGRAHSHANDWVRGVAMQKRRLSEPAPDDEDWHFRLEVDLHLFLVALRRVRRAALLAERAVGGARGMGQDWGLPDWVTSQVTVRSV